MGNDSLHFRHFIEHVLRHRVAVLCLCVLTTAFSGWVITRGVIASSIIKLFFGDNPEYGQYRALADRFAESDFLFVAFEQDDLLTPHGLTRLSRLAEHIESSYPEVARAHCVGNANSIRGDADTLDIATYSERFNRARAPLGKLRAEVRSDSLLYGLLVSDDGTSGAMVVELTRDDGRAIEALPPLLESIVNDFVAVGFARDELHMAGLVAESVEATLQARKNIERLFPLTVLLLVTVVYLLFLRLWPVIVTTAVAFIAITWTLAIAVVIDRQINLLLAAVPAVMMVVSFSDVIHLCSAYMLEVRAGRSKYDAIVRSGGEVGRACFYTSVTTLVGFAAMAFVPTPIFRQLGLVLGCGVAIALLLAMTLAPIFFSFMPVPNITAGGSEERLGRILDRFNMRCCQLAMGRPRVVVAFFVVLLGVAIAGIQRIEVETDMVERLSSDHPIRQAHAFIEERFAGTNAVDLYLSIDGDGQGDILEPERFAQIASLQKELSSLEGVDSVTSLVDVVRVLHRALQQGSSEAETDLPSSRAQLAQYLLLSEMSGGDDLERLVDDDRRTVRMSLRLDDNGFVATARVGQEAVRRASRLIPSMSAKSTGITYLFGEWLEFIIAGQKRGLVFAFVCTCIMMIIALRLVGAGIVSMIPNALPVITLGGYVGYFWDRVDSDTILVAMIAIGIAVDDTIHFLVRLRLEASRANSVDAAVHRTFQYTGRAIVRTTVILCVGFAPFATSDYFTTRILGTLLPLTLCMALVADLLMVPALVKLSILRMPLGQDRKDSTAHAA